MSHHTNQIEKCPLCSDKLKECDPKWTDIFWNVIKKNFPECHIAWGFRNEKDQNEYYRQGSTKARWPHSKHNRMVGTQPYSQALDLFQLDDDNVAWFPVSYYKAIDACLIQNGAPTTWSGDWIEFIEQDHFQLLE